MLFTHLFNINNMLMFVNINIFTINSKINFGIIRL